MPSEAISDVKIGSRASTRVGLEPVSSFQDNTASAKVLEDNYDAVVDDALAKYAWRFARKTADLGSPLAGANPPYPFERSYQLPDECMKLHMLRIDGRREVYYDLAGLVVSCMAGPDSTVEAVYTYRADESLWHPTFVEYVVLRLASILARAVKRDDNTANDLYRQATIQWRQAKFSVGQESTPDHMETTRLIAVRQ